MDFETVLRGLLVLGVVLLLIVGAATYGTERITAHLATTRQADVQIEQARAQAQIEQARASQEGKTERFQSFALALVTISTVASDNIPLLITDLILLAGIGYIIWTRQHEQR